MRGKLIGGCIDVFMMAAGTEILPTRRNAAALGAEYELDCENKRLTLIESAAKI